MILWHLRLRESEIFILLQALTLQRGLNSGDPIHSFPQMLDKAMVAPKKSGQVATIFHGNWCFWKTSILATGGYRLTPPRQCSRDWEMDFLQDFSWSLAAEVCPVYCLILSSCTVQRDVVFCSTRHHPLRFSNRYACWSWIGLFFLFNELWTSSSTFQVRAVIPWLFFPLAPYKNYLTASTYKV